MDDPADKYLDTDSRNARQLRTFAGDNRDQRGYLVWCSLWLAETLRIMRPGGLALLFTDWRQLPVTTDALQAGGFIWRGLVPWVKPSARPQAGRFAAQCEYVVWGSAGAMGMDYSAPCLPGFFQASSPHDREHPTQKPLDVMRELVRIVPEGATILDPFTGSGQTGVAALLEGRRFVGVEITEHYAALAADRLAAAERGWRPSEEATLFAS
jgi:site-specific DNA-methyltransferase (adenine-specific)